MSSRSAQPSALGAWRRLPATVVSLGVVSFLADLSSEMVYPLLPLFLTSVLGAGAVSLGLIEGVAESTASLVKLLSGRWSDRAPRRKPLVVAGYGLAGAARAFIGLATGWVAVLALRFVDRIGKGLRSAPRDALLAESAPPELRATAFGLHRAMDHAGAMLGPLVAAGLLALPGMTLSRLFVWTLVPSALVMLVLVFAVREPARPRPEPRPAVAPWQADVPLPLRRLLWAILLFALANASDAFLLLRLHEAGLGASLVALLWAGHHAVKMGASALAGRMADRRGRRPVLVAGWLVYAAVYLGFALVAELAALVVIFLVYGLALGWAEPAEKAWVADLAPGGKGGTAFGLYHAAVGLGALPASLGFGAIWQLAGPAWAFATCAALALGAVSLLGRVGGPLGRQGDLPVAPT